MKVTYRCGKRYRNRYKEKHKESEECREQRQC